MKLIKWMIIVVTFNFLTISLVQSIDDVYLPLIHNITSHSDLFLISDHPEGKLKIVGSKNISVSTHNLV